MTPSDASLSSLALIQCDFAGEATRPGTPALALAWWIALTLKSYESRSAGLGACWSEEDLLSGDQR
jgi:hypothetical protein